MNILNNYTLLNRRQVLQMLGIGVGSLVGQSLLSGCAVDPVTGKKEFILLSEADEIALDRKQSPYQFSTDYGQVLDQRLNSYINRVGLELSKRSHRPQMPYSFRAVNAAYINAYAFPGGSIAATRGILVELESEAELAALLSHEIGHVNARHTAEQSTKGMLANLLVAGATVATGAAGYGSAANLVQSLGGLSAGALLAHYSRDNEREADSLGMEYMTRAGYSPEGMVGLMEILQKNGRKQPGAIELMFATHPMSRERLQFARQQSQSTYARFLSGSRNRERYMDRTANLRKIKPAISAIQQANTALAKKQYEKADGLLNRALQVAPNDYTALVMRAKSQLAMKNTGQARRLALRSTQIYPEEAQGHLVTAMTDFIDKRYSSAYEQFNRYDTILPGNPEITFFKGRCLEGMQRRDQSAREYHRYLQQVRRGNNARYAYNRLKTWGYIQ